jgi:hypothetical protein
MEANPEAVIMEEHLDLELVVVVETLLDLEAVLALKPHKPLNGLMLEALEAKAMDRLSAEPFVCMVAVVVEDTAVLGRHPHPESMVVEVRVLALLLILVAAAVVAPEQPLALTASSSSVTESPDAPVRTSLLRRCEPIQGSQGGVRHQ